MARFFLFAVIVTMLSVAVSGDLIQEQKIVQGQNATEGEFPYIVAIRSKNALLCGGTVLTKSYILTAAHCCTRMAKKEDFHVYAGSIYLSKGGTNHSVASICVHSFYQPDTRWAYDYCIIGVSPSFNLGDKIKQTVLATVDWKVYTRDRVTVAGWGSITPSSSKPVTPDRLQKGVNFTVISNYECQKLTGLDLDSRGQICARGARGWQATWKGDAGGPLIQDGVQIGITSFGYHPSGTRLPTVYSRVMGQKYWIEAKVGSECDQLKYANKTF